MTTPGRGIGILVAGVAIALGLGLVVTLAPSHTIHLDPSDDAWELTGDTETGIAAGTPDAPLTAAIRNIRITHRAAAGDAAAPSAPEPGVIRAWGTSGAFPRSGDDVLEFPSDVVSGPWSAIEPRADGPLPLEPHVERPDGQGVPTVVAALRIEADRERTARLDLGFSDDASVFLNGHPLYSGRYSFGTNFPRRQSLITLDQASLYLPLEPGENVLMVVVSDAFGGWGVMGRIADRAGLRVTPWKGERSDAAMPEDTDVFDGSGTFVIPGLWDVHVHLSLARERALPVLMYSASAHAWQPGSTSTNCCRYGTRTPATPSRSHGGATGRHATSGDVS